MSLYEVMTAEEIRRSYKEAKNPEQQIRILADLNLCRKEDIEAIISGERDDILLTRKKAKESDALPRKRMKEEEMKQLAREYADGKTSQKALALKYGVSESRVYQILKKYKTEVEAETSPSPDPLPTPVTNPEPQRLRDLYESARELFEYIESNYSNMDSIIVHKYDGRVNIEMIQGDKRLEICQIEREAPK